MANIQMYLLTQKLDYKLILKPMNWLYKQMGVRL